jgi:hypothetical protein
VRNDFLRTVEHIEEIGVRRDTYLDEFVGKFDSKFDTQFVVLSTRLSPVREGCFLIGVQRVDEVLSPDVAMDCVVVVLASVGDFLTGFVGEGVVNNDDIFIAPLRVVSLLRQFK